MTEPVIVEAKPEELLPCPFCGSECAFEHDDGAMSATWSVFCRDMEEGCPIGLTNSLGYMRRVEAAKAWNKRHE